MDNRPNLVITGATKGIGRAIIEHFASIGANVVFCARQKQEVQELENELKVQFPTQVFSGFVADMSVASSRNAFFEHISNVFNRVHVLVNNDQTYYNKQHWFNFSALHA